MEFLGHIFGNQVQQQQPINLEAEIDDKITNIINQLQYEGQRAPLTQLMRTTIEFKNTPPLDPRKRELRNQIDQIREQILGNNELLDQIREGAADLAEKAAHNRKIELIQAHRPGVLRITDANIDALYAICLREV